MGGFLFVPPPKNKLRFPVIPLLKLVLCCLTVLSSFHSVVCHFRLFYRLRYRLQLVSIHHFVALVAIVAIVMRSAKLPAELTCERYICGRILSGYGVCFART